MFASRSSALTWLALPLLALLPVAFQVSGCTDESTAPAQLRSDAGVTPCTPGKRACLCSASGGCDPGLLCSAGRCFDTEGTKTEPPDPDVRPVIPAVLPNLRDASASPSDASTDSGSSSNG
jgi:hypothetical protein